MQVRAEERFFSELGPDLKGVLHGDRIFDYLDIKSIKR